MPAKVREDKGRARRNPGKQIQQHEERGERGGEDLPSVDLTPPLLDPPDPPPSMQDPPDPLLSHSPWPCAGEAVGRESERREAVRCRHGEEVAGEVRCSLVRLLPERERERERKRCAGR
jgi:hypothetical protein